MPFVISNGNFAKLRFLFPQKYFVFLREPYYVTLSFIYRYTRFDITFNFKDGTQTVFFSELEATKNSDIKSLGAPKKRAFLPVFCYFYATFYCFFIFCPQLPPILIF